ncbi:orotidine-5'-phosphate decarboxylase [Fructilactobacillus vespulae]|uniref:orotidine-5'-phosphate decarboxylase n=1 Tax=Fructilactobacillus vespulae TaxID=1249630 RepID=UPI0039B3E7A8
MEKPIMLALDFADFKQVEQFLESFSNPGDLTVKIGMELFYQSGPQVVKTLKARGCKIFLDLKLFDIPHTVEKSMERIGELGVDYVTAHTLGGSEMLTAAKRGLIAGAKRVNQPVPDLLGVTILTSCSKETLANELNCKLAMADQVVSLAKLAKQSGCDGVITSALELPMLTKEVGTDFKYVVPGIRMKQDAVGDQKRVATPEIAKQTGAFAIVVGRPVTQSENPVAAYRRYRANWNLEGE